MTIQSLTIFAAATMTALSAVGCGASGVGQPIAGGRDHLPVKAAAVIAAAIPAEQKAETPEPEPAGLPTACESEGSLKSTALCLPPSSFVTKLCAGRFPDVALSLFAKGTPWTRVYLAGDVEAWNASGGRTSREKLAFDEEVLVLSKRAPSNTGGIVMTGATASYDVLRWDGQCVSLMDGELTAKRPPAAKQAEVPFHRLEEATRHALLDAPKVKAAHEAMMKTCSVVGSPTQKKQCDGAQRKFAQAVATHVRTSDAVPAPSRRP